MPKALLFLCLCIFAVAVSAQTREDTFKRADRNGDGIIDSQENEAFVAADFNERDADQDGKLSRADLEVWMSTHVYGYKPGTPVALPANAVKAIAARDIKLKDRDNDGFISRNEDREAAAVFFKAMDRNGDGKLSHEEFGQPVRPPSL